MQTYSAGGAFTQAVSKLEDPSTELLTADTGVLVYANFSSLQKAGRDGYGTGAIPAVLVCDVHETIRYWGQSLWHFFLFAFQNLSNN